MTAPTSPRAVAATAETITSCLVRRASSEISTGSAFAVRASRPVEESSTRHGSSATSSGTAAICEPADSSSTVRRSVPNFFATAASSAETILRSSASDSRIAVSASISLFSLDRSSSSSIRSKRVVAQRGVQDVLRLDLAQREVRHQTLLRLRGVVAVPDDPDDLVDVEERDEEALDQVQPVAALGAAELAAA